MASSQIIKINVLWIIFCILLSLNSIESKTSNCRTKFREEDFVYCTKFGMPPNSEARATVIPRFMNMYRKAEETVNIQIGVFRDTDWDTIADTKKIACDVKKQKAMKVMDIDIPVDGTWGKQHNITFGNQNIPKIFYFVAMDCEHNTHSKAKTMPKIELEVTVVQVLSFGEVDHFSYEEDGTLTLHLILLILFSAIFGMTVYSYYEYQKQYERYDSPHFIMALALFMQMGAIFMQTLHLWMYSHNGRGIPIFDIFGLIGCMLSEITVSCLMMMIAHGWTIIYQDIDFDNNIEIYLPVGAIVVAVHLVLAAMTYIDLDAHHKYHDFSGVQGWVLIIFKLGLFLYFLYCVCQNIDKIPKRSMKFHRVFTILAIVYLLSVPLTIISSFFFQPYNRQFLYTIITHMAQALTLGIFLQQQHSSKSQYSKANLDSQGILPMGKFA